MINYYAKQTENYVYKVDFDTKKFNRVEHFGRMDYIYFIDEDGMFTVTTSDGEKTYEVHKGDLVLKLYSAGEDYDDKEFFIIHNDGIIDYVNRYNTFVKENKKRKYTDEAKCCGDVLTKAC